MFEETFVSKKHFLQSEPWVRFQRSRGNEVVERSGDGWEYAAIVERSRFSSRLYCPYGPTFVDDAALVAALADLEQTARELSLDFVRVEPRGPVSAERLEELGLVRSHHDVQPPHTIINDLRVPDLLASLKSVPRRRYRKLLREGGELTVSYDPADIDLFLDMIHAVADRTGMVPHSDDYFRALAASLFPEHDAGLMICRIDGRPAATVIFYTDGTVISYAHAASYDEFRKAGASTAGVIETMIFGADTGHTIFDTYGAAPEGADESNPWYGFTRFKESFGGKHVDLSGTWELPVRRLKYGIYTRLNRMLERG